MEWLWLVHFTSAFSSTPNLATPNLRLRMLYQTPHEIPQQQA